MRLMKLFDLSGDEDDRKISPYCWRIRLALAHKELGFASVPWRAEEKDAIAFSGQGQVLPHQSWISYQSSVYVGGYATSCANTRLQVPVLVDGDTTVVDSWRIAEYLESCYPNAPSFFGSKEGKGQCRHSSLASRAVVNTCISCEPVVILWCRERRCEIYCALAGPCYLPSTHADSMC